MKTAVYWILLIFLIEIGISVVQAQKHSPRAPTIPKTWDDKAIADLEIPLANPTGSPKHVSADYYYRIPVRPIYKTYPIYFPGHEPSGYMVWLRQRRPIVLWDDTAHHPSLRTEMEWISAGARVFEAPTDFFSSNDGDIKTVLSALEKFHVPATRDGVLPFFRYVVREKGKVEVGFLGCATCHSRIMPDGSVLKGAQGSFPDAGLGFPPEKAREFQRMLFATPWITPDPLAPIDHMGVDELTAVKAAIPIGVIGRHRTSIFYPVQVPDLIGVKDRKYLDRTGLQQHRSIVDMMRYAALNQGADDLANFDGFIPADFPNFKTRPAPEKESRYSDEQLYALALYVYSLTPPANPNKFDTLAQRGQQIFAKEGCVVCHTPPLYTNNKLTLAVGFTPPPEALTKFDILPFSVGTDSNLALKTRRGTGYYKVPSLRGVWYRGMFGHSGWCATLEDWFDPHRVQDDYVPTGFKPFGVKTFAVKGHPFGLELSLADRQALIAFLRTL